MDAPPVQPGKISSNLGQYELGLISHSSLDDDADDEIPPNYTVLPKSTFLDLKLLILNRTHVPLSRQLLEIQYQDNGTCIGEDSWEIGGPNTWGRYPRKHHLKVL
jgi:hypothetical protein